MVYSGSVEYLCGEPVFAGQHSKSDSRGTGSKFRYKNIIFPARNSWNPGDVNFAAHIALLDLYRMIGDWQITEQLH